MQDPGLAKRIGGTARQRMQTEQTWARVAEPGSRKPTCLPRSIEPRRPDTPSAPCGASPSPCHWLIWLPGFLLFRFPRWNRALRATLPVEERLFWVVMLSAAISSGAALVLAGAGAYSLDRVLLVNLALCVLLAIGGARPPPPRPGRYAGLAHRRRASRPPAARRRHLLLRAARRVHQRRPRPCPLHRGGDPTVERRDPSSRTIRSSATCRPSHAISSFVRNLRMRSSRVRGSSATSLPTWTGASSSVSFPTCTQPGSRSPTS